MSRERVMLLIDADNLSVDVMEQVIRLLLNQHGALHVRRAYCTAESAVANQNAFKRLGIKPMVNLAAGKNSTDIAMAVDAIDLVLAERPDVVVIASSDSDFAPLVQRLREKGCVVRGIGQKGKVGDETQDVYDDFTVLEHRGAAAKRAPARSTTRPARASRATAGRAAQPKQAAKKDEAAAAVATSVDAVAVEAAPAPVLGDAQPEAAAPAAPAAKRTTRARKTTKKAVAEAAVAVRAEAGAEAGAETGLAAAQALPPPGDAAAAPPPARARARKAKATAEPAPQPPAVPAPAAAQPQPPNPPAMPAVPAATLQAVLDCLPELSRGQSLALNVAVQRLRETRLLGKNKSSLKLFSQLSDSLELLPARNPSQVRLRR